MKKIWDIKVVRGQVVPTNIRAIMLAREFNFYLIHDVRPF